MFRRYKQCSCMNNNYQNNSCEDNNEFENDMIETSFAEILGISAYADLMKNIMYFQKIQC